MKKILNYIDGVLIEPQSKKYLENFNPSLGVTYSLVADSDHQDVLAAITSAEKAFPAWSKLSAHERSRYLSQIAEGLLKRLDEFAEAESIDSGKPLTLSKNIEIPRSAQNFQFFADLVTKFRGENFSSANLVSNETFYSPLGVVGCISPWNLPLYLFSWKIAPALAAGNTVVAKPSELTPMTAYLLSEVCREINLPPGVLNIVHGLGPKVGAPLVQNPKVKAVSFTGSTATGRTIAQSIAGQFKKMSLEMGGKNPNIIFADCDFEKTLDLTLKSSFQNQGQICLCGSRIFVEESLYEKFKNALVERTNALKIGNPLDPTTDQGALVSKAHLDKVVSYLELAKQEGGQFLTGGASPSVPSEFSKGYFLQPTLIEGLNYLSRTNQEEIFGPVATIMPFKSESEVVMMANSTNYGLSATVWTTDLKKAQRISSQLESGVVWINTWMNRDLRTPFGGVKESGYGREGGFDALKFFSEVKNVCTQFDIEVK